MRFGIDSTRSTVAVASMIASVVSSMQALAQNADSSASAAEDAGRAAGSVFWYVLLIGVPLFFILRKIYWTRRLNREHDTQLRKGL